MTVLLVALSVKATEREIYCREPQTLDAGTVFVDSVPGSGSDIDYHFRVRLLRSAVDSRWGVDLRYDGGRCVSIVMTRNGAQAFDSDYAVPVDVTVVESMDDEILSRKEYRIDRNVDASSDEWSIIIRRFHGDKVLSADFGQSRPLLHVGIDADSLCSIETKVMTAVGLSRLSLFCKANYLPDLADFHSEQELIEYLASSDDPNEAIWSYLDRDTDPRRLNLGGDYRLATVRRDDGGYDLLYLGGARINAGFWEPMRMKGRLDPTVFIGHFDLVWYDAYGISIDVETSADITDGALMKLSFPLSGSSVRFRRELLKPAITAP